MAFEDQKGPIATVIASYARPFDFTGRSTRTEFVYFLLGSGVITWMVTFPMQFIAGQLESGSAIYLLLSLFRWIAFYPIFALTGRRLQDFGFQAGWTALIFGPAILATGIEFLMPDVAQSHPLLGLGVLLFSLLSLLLWLGAIFWPGDKDDNIFGPNPRFDSSENG